MKAIIKGALSAIAVSFCMVLALTILETKIPANYSIGYWIAAGTFSLGALTFWWEKKRGGSSFSFRFK